jgi:uncharacterized NAD(P)/FAD-binding protein YdhS
VTVVNAGHPLARGVAYATRRPEHLLNVVARNMSALADQPDHFVEWLGTRSDFSPLSTLALREQFVPRRVYGDYLQSLFLWYSHAFADGKKVRIDTLNAEAIDVVPVGDRVEVMTTTGAALPADKVVLATGNPPPAALPGLDLDHPFHFRDPWEGWEQRLPDRREDVILLGAGLTMVDAVLTLASVGWQGKVYAVSRTGLLPQSHFKGPDYRGFPESDPSRLSLEEVHGLLQRHCENLRGMGLNPAILVDKLRPYTQRLWQSFTRADRLRFLNEFRTPWNVIRHRIAEPVHRQIMGAIEGCRLEIVKGRIRSLSAAEGGLRVVVDVVGGERVLNGGAVVNCTGPGEGCAASSPLYRNLLERGLVSEDDVGLGVRATSDFAALDAEGDRSPWLMAVGPPLKGMLWESTAVPELRNQAFRVAEVIVADLHASRAEVSPVAQTYADVLEYSI